MAEIEKFIEGLSETYTSNPMYEMGYKKGATDMEKAIADHDKQIRDEVIDEFVKLVIDFGIDNGYVDAESFMELAEQMKGEQNEE